MAMNTVDAEALAQAAAALSTYIGNLKENIQKMKDAATDCSDNMGSDVYSQKAITKLQGCISGLSKSLQEAENLRKKILIKKKQIEESGISF